MGEQGRIGSERHHVGIALQAGHESGLAEGCQEAIGFVFRMAGILSGEHLRPFSIIAVVAIGVREEPLWRTVVMLVHQIDLQPTHLRP